MNFDPQKGRILAIHTDIHNQQKEAWLRTEGASCLTKWIPRNIQIDAKLYFLWQGHFFDMLAWLQSSILSLRSKINGI